MNVLKKQSFFKNFPLGIRNIILITLILILVGCQKAEEVKVETETATDISIESDISDVDSIDEDLTSEELDNLESDLDEINW